MYPTHIKLILIYALKMKSTDRLIDGTLSFLAGHIHFQVEFPEIGYEQSIFGQQSNCF